MPLLVFDGNINCRLAYDECTGAAAPERLPPGGKLAKIFDF